MVPVETAKGVMKVRGESVEPVQLQVVCQTLWENCQHIWRRQFSEKKVITQEYLKTFGDVDQALSTFYESAITRVVKATGIKEGVLRRWFEQSLITSAGTRGTVFRGREDTVGIPNATVDELVNQHIIRAELRGGSRWYELTHDRFIEPIKVSNERWLREHSGGEQIPKRLEERAQGWARNGRQKKDLIDDEGELLVAERWLESAAAVDVGYSDTLFAFVQASRAAISEKQAKSARHLKLLVAALLIMVAGLLVAAMVAIRSQHEAKESQQKAEARELEATTARQMADAQKKLAEDQGKLADELTTKYKIEKDRADKQSTLARASERIAKQDKTKAVRYANAGKGLLSEARDAEANYQYAEKQSRDVCDKKKQLQKNLLEWEHIRAGYEALGDEAQQAVMSKRFSDVKSEADNLVCSPPGLD